MFSRWTYPGFRYSQPDHARRLGHSGARFCLRHPPTYIVDVQPDPKSAYYPVKNFPILAKLLEEWYQPVVRSDKGVIYRVRDGE